VRPSEKRIVLGIASTPARRVPRAVSRIYLILGSYCASMSREPGKGRHRPFGVLPPS
jgi:hypothetical protein